MSYGGGGGGGITAHVHSNLSSEGGSLNTDSLINNGGLYVQMVALG